ncbi:MAG: hypothetical protein Q8N26_08360 [Myxococcales bacterium]|nr:hypothetical protein [Myxococcales bacterium]
MSAISDAARAAAAAAAAARRAAELAAKKAAEAAAKKAAQAAAQKAAAAAAQKNASNKASLVKAAGNKPTASGVRQSLGKDELSQGLGRSLRARMGDGLGTPPPSAPTAGRTMSLTELRAVQAKGGPIASQSALQGATAGAAAAVQAPPTPEQRAAAGAREVQKAWDDSRASGRSEAEAANAASQKLRTLTNESTDPAYTNALIRAAAPTLDKVTTVLDQNARDDAFTGGADKEAVKNTVRALSDVATKAGPIGSFLIADQLAKKLPDDNELMHVDDGFYDHLDNGGTPELMAALGSRLEAYGKNEAKDELFDRNEGFLGWAKDRFEDAVDFGGDVLGAVGDATGAVVGFVGDAADGVMKVVGKAGEMAVDVAKGTVELAGDAANFTKEQVMEAAEYAAENGLKLAGSALNWVGDHARELAADALNIDGQLASLNSTGDSVTIGVGGKIGATVLQGGAEVEMKVTKTDDGYEMTLTGQLSGGVFAGLSIPGMSEASAEANATGIASATMKFSSLEEATKAAETVGGVGIAAAVGGPAGALLTGATAGDEIKFIGDHFEKGSIGLELSASAKAELGSTAGLGFGGSIEGTITTGARIEVEKGKPPALVLEQSVEAKGSLALGGPVQIPSLGGQLNGGSLDGSASISAETRVPLPEGFNLGDLARDPAGAMKRVGSNAIENATTKLSLEVDVHAGVSTEGLGLDLGADGGLAIELSAEAKTKDIVGALSTALKGDLGGALTQLGTKTNLDLSVSSYTESGFKIDESIKVPGFTIGVKAENTLRDETEQWKFEGTPAELAARGFDLFSKLQLNVG